MDTAAWDRQLRKYASEFDDRTIEVLTNNRQYLQKFIAPYVEGPLDDSHVERISTVYALDFGDGPRAYRQKCDTLPYEAELAIIGINEARLVEIHLGEDGDRSWLFKSALKLGKVTGILSDKHGSSEIGEKVIAGIQRAAAKNTKLSSERTRGAVLRRVNTLIERGMKPITACKHCAAEYGTRGKVFSYRTIYRAWEKQAQD